MKEVEAAAERAAAQSAAVIEEAMAQAEEARRRAEQDTQSRVRCLAAPNACGVILCMVKRLHCHVVAGRTSCATCNKAPQLCTGCAPREEYQCS